MPATIALSSCTPFRDAEYRRQLADLRSAVPIGTEIHAARKKIIGRYERVSAIHPYPSGRSYMTVSFGLHHTFLEAVAYAADAPSLTGTPVDAVVISDKRGKIETIK